MVAHRLTATMTFQPYDELCAWTLSLGDADFVHQHVVDAHMLQHATADTKPVGIAFALAGLLLHLEHGFTGREVQRAHMKMGKAGGPWPRFTAPDARGSVTAADVVGATPGPERIAAIDDWCASVWSPWREHRPAVLEMLRARHVLP
jgi:hypothetical protein